MSKVKICGLTNFDDAQVAVQAGADMLGFIFYEPSPRYILPKDAGEIIAKIRKYRSASNKDVTFIGVFVNAELQAVADIFDKCRLDAVQLHGEKSPEFVNHFQGRSYQVMRPQSLAEAEETIRQYLPCSSSEWLPCFLIDAYHPTLYGGTGEVTDWSMAANIASRYRLMMAGSLTPENVAEAVQIVKPWGVDVSSGVELRKGKKDHNRLRAFVMAAKEWG